MSLPWQANQFIGTIDAAGGSCYPGMDDTQLRAEMRSSLDRGYTVVKMKIGFTIAEDQRRIKPVLSEIGAAAQLAVDVNGRADLETASAYVKMLRRYPLFWYEEISDPLDYALQARTPSAAEDHGRQALQRCLVGQGRGCAFG
jgi:L-alanine-DL-glutamate epimerase-like enolase superfamily enzyme